MRFVALDVETANPDMSSICQIGIVHFEDGKVVDSWSSLVDPKDYFDGVNISIHGIDEDNVRGAPDFKQASSEVRKRLAGQIVAIHTAFDRNAIARASLKHSAEPPECFWLNTASVARRAWPEVAQKGYGLSALSQKFGIEFEHHNAVEDARAAGLILVRAMAEANLDLDAWLDRVKRPLGANGSDSMARDGNPEGSLYGEVVVFTGALAIPRREAADMAAKAGCETADGVTKHTTLLVVGDQDIRLLNGHEKSSKHRKAEELIAKGQPLRILTESDFASMVGIQ
ncbi:MAG TPA: exonuclease domain-containing protein [Rhodoferax sp.]